MSDRLLSQLNESFSILEDDYFLKATINNPVANRITAKTLSKEISAQDSVSIHLQPSGGSPPFLKWSLPNVSIDSPALIPIGSDNLIPITVTYNTRCPESLSSIAVDDQSGSILINKHGFYHITVSISMCNDFQFYADDIACGTVSISNIYSQNNVIGCWFLMMPIFVTIGTTYRSAQSSFFFKKDDDLTVPLHIKYYGNRLSIVNNAVSSARWVTPNFIKITRIGYRNG